MKRILLALLLSVVFLSCEKDDADGPVVYGPNLIVNGGFGNGLNSFTTDYLYTCSHVLGTDARVLYDGEVCIQNNSSYFAYDSETFGIGNSKGFMSGWASCPGQDGSTALIVNSFPEKGKVVIAQEVSLQAGKTYRVIVDALSIFSGGAHAVLSFGVDGIGKGANVQIDKDVCLLNEVTYQFSVSQTQNYTVKLTSESDVTDGCDFMIDNLRLQEVQ
jgi:hypothetical protein